MKKSELAVGAITLVIVTAALTALTTSVLKKPVDDTQAELSRLVYVSLVVCITCLFSSLLAVGVVIYA